MSEVYELVVYRWLVKNPLISAFYRFSGVSEYELMKEEIRIHTPMWSEIDGRIILLNQDKIGTGDASSAATSAQHFSEPFTSYFALLLAAVALNVMNRL